MDKTIDDYSQSLVDLERQKQQLEQVMKKMGEEWEESGAGIGWLHSLQSPRIAIDHHHQLHRENQVDEVVEEEEESDLMALTSPLTPEEVKDRHLFQFFSHHHHSPDYLDSLLTMNETLLAQSVNANTSSSSSSPLSSTATTPTINTTLSSLSSSMVTPPITPDELDNQKQNQNNNNNHTDLYFHSK
ncbi:hypothetical protein BJ944DRAFT_274245 [Cunninghamella echinulata]|nr:hypothetical protein BJ944DRAFT_274245 [Cunninghamella echinulata]